MEAGVTDHRAHRPIRRAGETDVAKDVLNVAGEPLSKAECGHRSMMRLWFDNRTESSELLEWLVGEGDAADGELRDVDMRSGSAGCDAVCMLLLSAPFVSLQVGEGGTTSRLAPCPVRR